MADETVSIERLLELAAAGHKITTTERPTFIAKIQAPTPDTGPTTIAQFDELITKLNEIKETNKYRIEADRSRFAAQVELLAVLQRLAKTAAVSAAKPHPTINLDLEPLQKALTAVLSEVQKNMQMLAATKQPERQGYEFSVERTPQGFVDKIIATPVGASLYKN